MRRIAFRFLPLWRLGLREEEPDVYYELAFRPLTEREREILDFLLTADLPGVEELREQAEAATATRYSSRDPSFGLWVDPEEKTRPSPLRTRPAIQTSTKPKSDADRYKLKLLVDEDGWLSAVELTTLHEEEAMPDYGPRRWSGPEDLPPPSEFEPPGPGLNREK